MTSYTIWVKVNTGDYCRLKTFLDEELAEKYLDYVDRFCEVNPDFGIDDLYVKEDGLPIYQIYYVNSDGDEEIEEEWYFDFDEMLDELNELAKNNPFSEYDYKEINLDDQDIQFIEIPEL